MSSSVKNALDKFGKDVIQQSRTRLTKGGSNYTKELYNGLGYESFDRGAKFGLTFTMPLHGAVLDEGISGT